MTFRIHALPAADFADLHAMSDTTLLSLKARRVTADASPGYPCRVSLRDAKVGETLILVNFVSMPAETPYRASHAIYVRAAAETAQPAPGEVPEMLTWRLLSLRGFGADHMLRATDVVDGRNLAAVLKAMLADPGIAEAHIHHAAQGCYAARATRAAV